MMMLILLWGFSTLMKMSWLMYIYLMVISYFLLMKYFPLFYDYLYMISYVDCYSFGLYFLSVFLTIIMFMSMYHYMSNMNYYMFFIMNTLLLFLMFSFISNNLLMYYIFFECSLVPTFFLILGWGYQPERIQASIYFMFYTLFASLPLLIIISWLGVHLGNLSFFSPSSFSGEKNLFFCVLSVFLFLAFLVKLPMFIFHLWLPKAHVEAPVAGSMVLAGVLLKLGGFGLIRCSLFSPFSLHYISSMIYSLSLSGMVFVGLICCRMNDLKALVAYSSVAHMGLVISGILSYSVTGYIGGLMMMLGHGFSSSGLFCIVNLYYERTMSRSIFLNKSLSFFFPSMSLMMFLLCSSNISAPPTINLLSEVYLMYSVMNFSYLMMLLFPLGTFLGAVFTFFLFSFTQHGKSFSMLKSSLLMNFREFHMMFLHLVPINVLFLMSFFFMF